MAEKVGEAFVEIRADLSRLKADMAMMKGTVTKSATAMADKFRAAGRAMTIAGAVITAAFGYAVKGSMDLEAKLRRVEIQAGATAKEMEEIKKVALSKEMVKLGKSGAQVADVFNRLASEGYNIIAMRKMLNPIIETAIVLGTEEGETTKLMLNLMQQYNLEAKDMAYISDVLAGALANTSFQGSELVETMKYAGVAASQLGWSLEGTIPIIDAVIKVTGEASMAGTQFRMMVTKLRDPTAEMAKEFAKVGITLDQVAEAIKTPIGLINLLNKAHEEGANLVSMFGARAASAAAVIARQSVPAVEALTKKVSEQGFAQKAVGEIMDTTAGKFKTFGAALQNIRTTIGDVLLPTLTELAGKAAEIAIKIKEWADAHKPLVDWIIKVTALLGILAAIGGPILLVVSAFLRAKSAVDAVTFALKLLHIKINALALATGPIGLLVIAIGGLYLAWEKNLFGIRDITDKVFDSIILKFEKLEEGTKRFVDGLTDTLGGGGGAAGAFADDMEELNEVVMLTAEATGKAGAGVGAMGKIVKDVSKEIKAAVKLLRDEYLTVLEKVEDTIYRLTHTEYETSLRLINREYDVMIEKLKTLGLSEENLAIAIEKANEARKLQIEELDKGNEVIDETIDKTEELIEVTEEVAEAAKEAGEVVAGAGVLGGQGWDNFTTSIKEATVALSNFSKEGVASAVATIKMHFFPLINDLQNAVNNASGIFKQIAQANLDALKQTMAEQIAVIKYGYQEYMNIMEAMQGGGSLANVLGSFQTGGIVPKTGLYQLHQGETVVPNQNTYNNSFSPTVNLTVQGGGDSKNIAQEVESVLYDMGRQFKRRGFEMIPGRG